MVIFEFEVDGDLKSSKFVGILFEGEGERFKFEFEKEGEEVRVEYGRTVSTN